jgi:hypothetical protein
VVVVDDCAMTGARFREILAQLPAERVAFAHLYSHPKLRAAILTAEPRVEACLASRDLSDVLTDPPEGVAWWDRLPGETYLRVPSEVACFAWSEPDRVVHSPVDGKILPGWRMIPPGLCLKNRQHPQIPVVAQEAGPGPLRPGPDVFFVNEGEDVIAASTSTGVALRLQGLAAAVWRALLATGSLFDAETVLAEQFAVDRAVLHQDVSRVILDLRGRGLLTTDAGTR